MTAKLSAHKMLCDGLQYVHLYGPAVIDGHCTAFILFYCCKSDAGTNRFILLYLELKPSHSLTHVKKLMCKLIPMQLTIMAALGSYVQSFFGQTSV